MSSSSISNGTSVVDDVTAADGHDDHDGGGIYLLIHIYEQTKRITLDQTRQSDADCCSICSLKSTSFHPFRCLYAYAVAAYAQWQCSSSCHFSICTFYFETSN